MIMNCLGGFEDIQLVLPFCNGYQMGGVPVVFQVSKKDNINATSEPLFCPCAPLSMVQRESVAHQLAGGNHEYFVGSISVYLLAMIYCMVSYILYGILHIVLMTADVPAGFLLLTGFCL